MRDAFTTRWPVGEARGLSLLEVLVAIAVLSVGLGALAQAFLLARRANAAAHAATLATVLAARKMEELRTHPWSLATGGSLQSTVAGFSDFFDGAGRAAGPLPPPAAAFVRRWSIEALPDDPVLSRVLAVRVLRTQATGSSERVWPGMVPDEARLFTIVTEINR